MLGEVDKAEGLVRRGASVNATRSDGATPLHLAAGHPALVRFLISRHAPLEARDDAGYTPLYIAAGQATPDAALELIKAGANVNAAGRHGETPLIEAAQIGSFDTVRALVDHGANVNVQTDYGESALVAAAERPSSDAPKIVALFLQHGANVKQYGDEALLMGVENPDVVRLLIDAGAHVDRPERMRIDSASDIPLTRAAIDGSDETVRLLLDHGAKVDVGHGYEPVDAAVDWSMQDARHVDLAKFRTAKLHCAELLLDHGAPVGAHSLALAAAWAWPPVLKLLLDHGANVNGKNADGKTALMMAVSVALLSEVESIANNDSAEGLSISTMPDIEKSVDMLLARGADVNAKDNDGTTVLMHAVGPHGADFVARLLKLGADPTPKDSDGNTALSLAERDHYPDIARILKSWKS